MSFAAPNHFDLVFVDLNFEEDNVNVSPPLKFFSAEFLNKLTEITSDEAGLIAINTLIDTAANRRKVVQALKAVPGCVKFSSGMQEEANEMFYVAKGAFDRQHEDRLDDTDNRVQKMGQVINTLKLPRGILLNREKMQVCYHVEEMRKI